MMDLTSCTELMGLTSTSTSIHSRWNGSATLGTWAQ